MYYCGINFDSTKSKCEVLIDIWYNEPWSPPELTHTQITAYMKKHNSWKIFSPFIWTVLVQDTNHGQQLKIYFNQIKSSIINRFVCVLWRLWDVDMDICVFQPESYCWLKCLLKSRWIMIRKCNAKLHSGYCHQCKSYNMWNAGNVHRSSTRSKVCVLTYDQCFTHTLLNNG